ncbi:MULTISPECIES: hypothetical protein [Spirosoma]|uniref:Uncharacterized protein n=1 Tax=Spirosoma liriopis TaxID=2937440 RepID=A0ABT0HEG5_9BACT|nr:MULTISPECIES: hypothetical protein [Spirosoma]MCK8490549.1 hypothetical protein [Spirosoma liriopis]UHG89918.1 hypothetical protein LQ777_16890 [Spirosoma oryzicola]
MNPIFIAVDRVDTGLTYVNVAAITDIRTLGAYVNIRIIGVETGFPVRHSLSEVKKMLDNAGVTISR